MISEMHSSACGWGERDNRGERGKGGEG